MSKSIAKSAIFILISMLVIQTLSMKLYLLKTPPQNCDGPYDLSDYARANSICIDCLDLYKDSNLYIECRSNCFNNIYFERCANTFMEKIDANILVQKVKGINPPREEIKETSKNVLVD